MEVDKFNVQEGNQWGSRFMTVKAHLEKKRVLVFLLVLFIISTFALIIGLAVTASNASDGPIEVSRPNKVEFGTGAFDARYVREYYIQAEKIAWDYLPKGKNLVNENDEYIEANLKNGPSRIGSTYTKYVYKGYTDKTFSTLIPTPKSQGYVGPTIKAEAGEIIYVHFRNLVDMAVSVHPHGVRYDKKNEGALYADNTNSSSKFDDIVHPGQSFTYKWDINADFAPTETDPNCVPFVYHSHIDTMRGINSGLVGALLVCKPGTLSPDGTRSDVDKENILYFDLVDEAESWLFHENLGRCRNPAECRHLFDAEDSDFMESLKKDSINGYMFGNLPDLEVCTGERVVWYIFSLNAELHPVTINGHTFVHHHHRSSVIGIWAATFVSAQTISTKPGRWLVACMNSEHNRNGMTAYLMVKDCGAPTANNEEHLSGKIRQFFLAAETEVWDYAPSGTNLYDGGSLTQDGTTSAKYFAKTNNRIGGQYKKARFHQYTDSSFQKKTGVPHHDRHLGILGPVMTAEVGDVIHVTLFNKLTHPVSMFLQGVSLDKSQDGYRMKDPNSLKMEGYIVNPGETRNYRFTVPWSVSPEAADPNCLTYMYYSAYNFERDISSGLVGPLLICRTGTILKSTGRQDKPEVFLSYSEFDENLSWYIDENINSFTDGDIDKTDEDFMESNIMRSINGRSYGNLENIVVCKGSEVVWHVLSFGQTDGLHGVTFSGNNVRISGVNRDSQVSISGLSFTGIMDAENVGNWSISCYNDDHFEAGMKAIYTVDLCGNDTTAYRQVSGITRTYHIAAVERLWNYSPQTVDPVTGENYSNPDSAQHFRVQKDGKFIGSSYIKALFREFTDDTFTTEIPVDDNTLHLGILGPIIRANVGDTIKVIFKNMASRSYSIHPHGISYNKENEGMSYGPDHSNTERNKVQPGATVTYTWDVPQWSGPASNGPNCVGSFYTSAVNVMKDTYSGLIGPLVICKAGILSPDNKRHDSIKREFALLFQAFDENKSWYIDRNILEASPLEDTTSSEFEESNMYDSINGLIFNNLQGLIMNRGEKVVWYIIGLGASEDIHTAHFHGQTMIRRSFGAYIADVIEVFPGVYETAEMFAENPGIWLIHCHVNEHAFDGMTATFVIK